MISSNNIPENLDKLQNWLHNKEQKAANKEPGPIVPGTEKLVVWSGGSPIQTAISLVYIHGFVGSRQSLAPALEQLASKLEANIFFTRLAGCGQGPDAIGKVHAEDWIQDTTEAWEIGAAIGRKVILIGMSTGCPQAAWCTTIKPQTAALIMISANFWPAKRIRAALLLAPFGYLLARVFIGKYHDLSSDPQPDSKFYTNPHHVKSLITMMKMVQLGRKAALESITCPSLMIYTEEDKVVSVSAIKKAYARLGSLSKKLVNIEAAKDHELGSTIRAPEILPLLSKLIREFIEKEVLNK